MKSANLLVVALVLACATLLPGREANAIDTFSYRFTDDSSRPLESWGGLLGALGTYNLVGTLDLNIDDLTDTAWFSNVEVTLIGEPGPLIQLNGQSLPLFHDLTSMVGTVVDGTSIHFEHSPAMAGCSLGECSFPSFEESKFTFVDVSLTNLELRLSATSGVRFWFDTPSYQITEAVGVLVVNTNAVNPVPEPSSLVAMGVIATLALGTGRVRRHE